jgi:predicted metal-binding protein
MQVEVEELFEARVQAVLLIRCGRCARRHFEPQEDAPRERYYRCKCRAWNALPGRES